MKEKQRELNKVTGFFDINFTQRDQDRLQKKVVRKLRTGLKKELARGRERERE